MHHLQMLLRMLSKNKDKFKANEWLTQIEEQACKKLFHTQNEQLFHEIGEYGVEFSKMPQKFDKFYTLYDEYIKAITASKDQRSLYILS